LSQWLKCGFVQQGKLYPTKAGTPQGGIISPTLANMTLDGLEKAVKKSCPPRRKVNFVRYADVQPQARFAPNPVKLHTHLQQVAPCVHVYIAGGADGLG
ncbi:MAG: hypothetical protein GWP12_04095, partial [Nitrospirae bacterium]|nr:hypothetical protein [Nitrospirota bacterium]